jgi:hypothetical protein
VVRHPSYAGPLVFVTGFEFGFDNWSSVAICPVLPWDDPAAAHQGREDELTRVPGDQYDACRMRRSASSPALWVALERHSNKPTRFQLRRFQHQLFVAADPAPVWIVEAKATGALATGRSALDAVAEVHDTVGEPVLLQQV